MVTLGKTVMHFGKLERGSRAAHGLDNCLQINNSF
jgi:hypothetical protein